MGASKGRKSVCVSVQDINVETQKMDFRETITPTTTFAI